MSQATLIESKSSQKPLSEKPLGYVYAFLGGLLGGPVGLITSPSVLFMLNQQMKEKGGKRPNRFLTWALIGVIGSPISTLISQSAFPEIYKNDTSVSSTSSSVASTNSSETEENTLVPLGKEAAVRDDRSAKITSSKIFSAIYPSNQFMDPVKSKGGKLVAVYMTIKNTGKESGNMFWSQFELKDSQGRTYKDIEDLTEIMSINDWTKEQGLSDKGDQLFPGATAKTVLVFRVAPDAKDLYLVANGNSYFAIK